MKQVEKRNAYLNQFFYTRTVIEKCIYNALYEKIEAS